MTLLLTHTFRVLCHWHKAGSKDAVPWKAIKDGKLVSLVPTVQNPNTPPLAMLQLVAVVVTPLCHPLLKDHHTHCQHQLSHPNWWRLWRLLVMERNIKSRVRVRRRRRWKQPPVLYPRTPNTGKSHHNLFQCTTSTMKSLPPHPNEKS
jgi:hypothetical protein